MVACQISWPSTSRIDRAPSRAARIELRIDVRVLGRPGHVALHDVAVAGGVGPEMPDELGVLPRHDHQRPPAMQRRQLRVERERTRDLQQARGALGALDVASDPEAVIGDAGDHDTASA